MRKSRRHFASAKIKTSTRTCEISGRGYRASSRFAEINVKRAQLPAGNRVACGRADPTGARAMTMLDRCIAV